MAMDEPPLAVDASIDVRDADGHGAGGPIVDDHLAPLESYGVAEVPAGEGDRVVRDEAPAPESAGHPPERLGQPLVSPFDGTPRPEQRGIAGLRQQSTYGSPSPAAIAASAARTRSTASLNSPFSPGMAGLPTVPVHHPIPPAGPPSGGRVVVREFLVRHTTSSPRHT